MKAIKNKFNKIKENSGIFMLVFGLLIISRNYIWIDYRGYETGIFYFIMNFVGIIAIIYGGYLLLKKK